jgi:hypothetical protein
MGQHEYVTIELRGNGYVVAHHSSSVPRARGIRWNVHQAWKVAERIAAARGNCEISAGEELGRNGADANRTRLG